ncbi:MAG: hypothetical protein ABW166_04680 [Sedimenticola sp.]
MNEKYFKQFEDNGMKKHLIIIYVALAILFGCHIYKFIYDDEIRAEMYKSIESDFYMGVEKEIENEKLRHLKELDERKERLEELE